MSIADNIYAHVQKLPNQLQAEVLDFVEFLLLKLEQDSSLEDQRSWTNLSLTAAMRGMENEESPVYTADDVLRPFGLCKGEFTVPDDFDELL